MVVKASYWLWSRLVLFCFLLFINSQSSCTRFIIKKKQKTMSIIVQQGNSKPRERRAMECRRDLIKPFSNLFIVTTHYTYKSTHAGYYCYCWLYPCSPCCPLQNILYFVALVDSTHAQSVGASVNNLHRTTLHKNSRCFG